MLCASAPAMTTRCFSPPLSVLKARPSNCPAPVADERPARDGQILRTFEREGAEMRKPPHQYDVEDAEIKRRLRLLGNERDPPRDLAVRPLGERTAVQRHRSDRRVVHPSEQLEEGRLAGSVRSENADQFAPLDVEADIVEDDVMPHRALAGSVFRPAFDVRRTFSRTSSRCARFPRASIAERHPSGPEHVALSPLA